jgi:glycosyltransferase involved in cell wall biosynthesis
VPRVSVILTCFNQAQFLREAIDSALNQTYEDFELLLVDNGSTDDSAGIMREYDRDPRVRCLLHEENKSLSARFNASVAESRGELITFHYGDDWYLPRKLELQVAEFDRLDESYGVVYGILAGFNETTGAEFEYPALRASGDVIRDMLSGTRAVMDMITPMIRRECLELHPFDEGIFAETEAIYLRIALTHKFRYLPERLAVHRDHGANAGKAVRRNLEQHQLALANLRRNRALFLLFLFFIDVY